MSGSSKYEEACLGKERTFFFVFVPLAVGGAPCGCRRAFRSSANVPPVVLNIVLLVRWSRMTLPPALACQIVAYDDLTHLHVLYELTTVCLKKCDLEVTVRSFLFCFSFVFLFCFVFD
jgi:hypothetical protein